MGKRNKKSFFGITKEFEGKVIDFSGGVLTKEIIEEAARKAVENYGVVGSHEYRRIISYDGHKMLKKIQKIKPDWDYWSFEYEIWAKAKELNLI